MSLMEKHAILEKNSIVLLLGILLMVAIGALMLGQLRIPPATILEIFASRILPIEQTWEPTLESVLFDVRLPRLLAGILVGAGLSISGASFQGLFRNPLVSPHILGVSAGAGMGAALAIT